MLLEKGRFRITKAMVKPMLLREKMTSLHILRFSSLPDLSLYMDQVVSFLEKQLEPFVLTSEDKLITPTMINNYVKLRLIPPPEKKRYTREHLAMLFICVLLKHVMTLNELDSILKEIFRRATVGEIYDLFCDELENAVHAMFGSGSYLLVQNDDLCVSFLRTAASAYALQLYARDTVIGQTASETVTAGDEEKTDVKPEKEKKKKQKKAENGEQV